MACTAAQEKDNPSPDDLMLFEEMEGGSEDECDGHEKILEEELQKVMVSPVETFTSAMVHSSQRFKLQAICEPVFKDVTRLPRLGSPGNLVVFGDNAYALGSTHGGHGVYLAASEVGDGRLVFMSSSKLSSGILDRKGTGQFAILHENIIQWVTNSHERSEDDPVTIVDFKNVPDLKSIDKNKAVVVAFHLTPVVDRSDDILEFIKSGGGFIIGRNPIDWSDNHSELLQTGHPFFTAIGIAVTLDKIFIPTGDHKVNLTDEYYHTLLASHIGAWLSSCVNTPVAELGKLAKSMRSTMDSIPSYAIEFHADKLSSLFKKGYDHMKNKGPSPKNIMRHPSMIGAADLCCVLINKRLGPAKAPSVEHFPGDFAFESLPMECVELSIKPRGNISECHPTGYYLPPGKELILTIANEKPLGEGWTVRIGAHSDKLYGKSSLKRWPEVCVKSNISRIKQLKIYSAHGGNVYIRCPEKSSEIALIRFENVVETPYFNLDDPARIDNWERNGRKAPGLWADISGKHIRFTLPSASVRDMTVMTDIMETWDRVMRSHLELRGTDPMLHKKEWIVYDTQISAGSMHSGYPIMGQVGDATNPKSEKFILNNDRIRTSGAWGPYHELGHNMQRGHWTFSGMREVTCNIFALHAIEKVAGKPVWEHSKMKDPSRLAAFTKHFRKEAPYEDWHHSLALSLAFYGHLAHTFGWDTYKAVFTEYESIRIKEYPRNNQDKIDQWLVRFSKHAGYSIAPLMDLWGVAYSAKGFAKVTQSAYMPDDRITQLVPEWTDKVMRKYPGMTRSKEEFESYMQVVVD